ncbi:unnamed protein product [Ectocarpus sp. CCAP 1310/34]|nr:unnamed protein product [Ectocarpus sp. CCAP 1310/34]
MWSGDTREAEDEREGESAMSDSQVGGSSCTQYRCTREPTRGVAGQKAGFCSRHSLAASVNVSKECNIGGCSTRAHYGLAGSKKREKCASDGCFTIASFGVASSKKKEFCSKHALEGMVNLVRKACARDGCFTSASFGVVGGPTEFCDKHALEGMVNLSNRRCASDGCFTTAYVGVAGSKKMGFCSKHALEGMFSLEQTTCVREGCRNGAKCGLSVEKNSARGMPFKGWSAQQGESANTRAAGRDPSMVLQTAWQFDFSIKLLFCFSTPLSTVQTNPSFMVVVAGTTKPVACSEHAAEAMINVVNKECGRPGCQKQPTHGLPGTRTREFCFAHAPMEMINLHINMCGDEGCSKQRSHGVRARATASDPARLGGASMAASDASPSPEQVAGVEQERPPSPSAEHESAASAGGAGAVDERNPSPVVAAFENSNFIV